MIRADILPAVGIVSDGIQVLRTRDGKPITDEECWERAANIVEGLRGRYLMIPRAVMATDYEPRHIPGCACEECRERSVPQ